ncbi:extended synaptotagmin-1-like isoform X2 [Xenopus tropicalis]|uniref:Extended synaptotagmin-1-like isoform X2 n=1 Tax=Xenopus tropicalis TaxID=8364 RepID=A0A8J1IXH1_XENTR|nr:extended synaptotagmin-1-like isoform X2 [Xenopus tropicalis]
MESISAVPDAAMLDQLNNSEEKPTARVELKIQDAKRKTKFRKDAKSPEWKQKFSFPLKDPRNEVLKGSGWRKSRK